MEEEEEEEERRRRRRRRRKKKKKKKKKKEIKKKKKKNKKKEMEMVYLCVGVIILLSRKPSAFVWTNLSAFTIVSQLKKRKLVRNEKKR